MVERSFEFTDLVLIIGTNPLPNYVVAKYFLVFNQKLERIWLIYSEGNDYYQGTKQFAEDIRYVLRKELKQRKSQVEFRLSGLSNISQAETIKKEVHRQLESEKISIKKAHLNYTGGTKAMAVHIYQALNEQGQIHFTSSYLDARDFKIRMDDDPGYDTGDLRDIISLEWEDLFRIHNTEKQTPKKEYKDKIEEESQVMIIEKIKELAESGKINALKEWVNKARPLFENETDGEYKQTIQTTLSEYHPEEYPELFAFLAAFPPHDRYVDEKGQWVYENFKISGSSQNTPELKGFIDGKWLEAYVHWALEKGITDEKINKSSLLPNLLLRTRTGEGTQTAEIDALVTNGYQICGISCSTSAITKNLKAKGFEIILRSRQLGGDEARAVLITLLQPESANDLENDLKASTRTDGDKFLILGIDDLKEDVMWRKLKKHIYK